VYVDYINGAHCTDTRRGSLGGRSFVVKEDINRNRTSADENTQNSEIRRPAFKLQRFTWNIDQ